MMQNEVLRDDDTILTFLEQKYLYWLEALSLMRCMLEGVIAIQKLEKVVAGFLYISFLHEIERPRSLDVKYIIIIIIKVIIIIVIGLPPKAGVGCDGITAWWVIWRSQTADLPVHARSYGNRHDISKPMDSRVSTLDRASTVLVRPWTLAYPRSGNAALYRGTRAYLTPLPADDVANPFLGYEIRRGYARIQAPRRPTPRGYNGFCLFPPPLNHTTQSPKGPRVTQSAGAIAAIL